MTEKCCPLCGEAIVDIPFTIVPERGMVFANGKFVLLSAKEMQLLELLGDRHPHVVTTETAMHWIYQLEHDEPEQKIIDVFICNLRKKIQPLGIEIETAWGRGYYLRTPKPPRVVLEPEDDEEAA